MNDLEKAVVEIAKSISKQFEIGDVKKEGNVDNAQIVSGFGYSNEYAMFYLCGKIDDVFECLINSSRSKQ